MAQVDKQVSVVMVAIGGYARSYVRLLLDEADQRGVRFAGAVDPTVSRQPSPEVQAVADELRARNVPIYGDLASFYAADSAHPAVVASPIERYSANRLVAMKNAPTIQ